MIELINYMNLYSKKIIITLDNESTIKFMININDNKITFYVDCTKSNFIKFIQFLKNNNDIIINITNDKIKYCKNINSFNFTYKNNIIIKMINSIIKYNNCILKNLYFNIFNMSLIEKKKNNCESIKTIIDFFDKSISNNHYDIIFNLIRYNNIETLLYLIKLNLIHNKSNFNENINKYFHIIKNNNITCQYNVNEYEYNLSEYITFLYELEENNMLINYLNNTEYNILTKLFFNQTISYYKYDINSVKIIVCFYLIDKLNIIDVKYLKNNKSSKNTHNDNKIMFYRVLKKKIRNYVDNKYLLEVIKCLNNSDKIFIYNFLKIMNILFYIDNDRIIYNSIKVGFILKNLWNIDNESIKIYFDIYNHINIYYNKLHRIDIDYFIELKNNKELFNFELITLNNLTIINNDFKTKKNNINIIDYQDCIGLLYEYIYNNNIKIHNIDIEDFCKENFECILYDIKSNYYIHSDIDQTIDDPIFYNNKKNNYKYKKYKNKYLKLKKIENILNLKYFDISLLNNFNEINDELVTIILNRYSNCIIDININSDDTTDTEEDCDIDYSTDSDDFYNNILLF